MIFFLLPHATGSHLRHSLASQYFLELLLGVSPSCHLNLLSFLVFLRCSIWIPQEEPVIFWRIVSAGISQAIGFHSTMAVFEVLSYPGFLCLPGTWRLSDGFQLYLRLLALPGF